MESDPRVERTRGAIRAALVALVKEEGLPAVTHQRVAERAGIGRATVYRHFASPEDLVHEAFDCMDAELPPSDDGTFAGQLRAIAGKIARDGNDPAARGLMVGMMQRAQCDPDAQQRQAAMVADLLRQVKAIPGAPDDAEIAVAQVVGGVLFRTVVAGKKADAAFLDALVSRVTHGTSETV